MASVVLTTAWGGASETREPQQPFPHLHGQGSLGLGCWLPPASTLPPCSLFPAQIQERDIYTRSSHILISITLPTQPHPLLAALRVSDELAIAKSCGCSAALNHS